MDVLSPVTVYLQYYMFVVFHMPSVQLVRCTKEEHPCLMHRDIGKYFDKKPFVDIEVLVDLSSIIIQLVQFGTTLYFQDNAVSTTIHICQTPLFDLFL